MPCHKRSTCTCIYMLHDTIGIRVLTSGTTAHEAILLCRTSPASRTARLVLCTSRFGRNTNGCTWLPSLVLALAVTVANCRYCRKVARGPSVSACIDQGELPLRTSIPNCSPSSSAVTHAWTPFEICMTQLVSAVRSLGAKCGVVSHVMILDSLPWRKERHREQQSHGTRTQFFNQHVATWSKAL